MIATLPDYVDSQVRRYFDQELSGIAEAASALGYALDRFHLPEWPMPATVLADDRRRRHEIEPGAIIFRSVSGPQSRWLVVLVALETPTAGLHTRAFRSALALNAEWRRQTETAQASEKPEPLRILGPAFSGTATSLKATLCGADTSWPVTVVSGAPRMPATRRFSPPPAANRVAAPPSRLRRPSVTTTTFRPHCTTTSWR